MGAVRILKLDWGQEFPWLARSGGCRKVVADDCEFGTLHGGYCNDYANYTAVLRDLNNNTPYTLGGYISK